MLFNMVLLFLDEVLYELFVCIWKLCKLVGKLVNCGVKIVLYLLLVMVMVFMDWLEFKFVIIIVIFWVKIEEEKKVMIVNKVNWFMMDIFIESLRVRYS